MNEMNAILQIVCPGCEVATRREIYIIEIAEGVDAEPFVCPACGRQYHIETRFVDGGDLCQVCGGAEMVRLDGSHEETRWICRNCDAVAEAAKLSIEICGFDMANKDLSTQNAWLETALRDAINCMRQSQRGSIGSPESHYLPQIRVERVERWQAALDASQKAESFSALSPKPVGEHDYWHDKARDFLDIIRLAWPTVQLEHRLMVKDRDTAGGPDDPALQQAYERMRPIAISLSWNVDDDELPRPVGEYKISGPNKERER